MNTTGYLFHEAFLEHRPGPRHPEKPSRLTAVNEYLRETGLWTHLSHIEPRSATDDEIASIHDPAYIRRIEDLSSAKGIFMEDQDTIGSPGTWRAACLAAGAVVTAADAIMRKHVVNAFCAIRPPGHHALRDRGMGFCFFNNLAIGARYLQRHHGLRRIAIVDWDVHHGNGTQDAFYDDSTVLYCSLHQFPHYPGSGRRDQRGTGDGTGYTLNIPMAAGSTDRDYLKAFEEELLPACGSFAPDAILISAGFDAAVADPLGGIQITADGFAAMTRMLCDLAGKRCDGRVLSVLEGGYDLESLGQNVKAHIAALLECAAAHSAA